MYLFHTQDISGDTATLHEEEARHCTQVLRHRVGDGITFVDGQGGWYEGVIEEVGKRTVRVRVVRQEAGHGRRPVRLHLAVGPTKNMARMEWLVEKATEMGFDTLTPLLCRHAERREVRTDRLEKIALAAMKQSLKAWLPQIRPMQPFGAFVAAEAGAGGQRFIAHLGEGFMATHLKDNYLPGQDVCILVGPEGGFSPEEVATATAAGFTPVSLGHSRLRTETAGLAACHIVNLLND